MMNSNGITNKSDICDVIDLINSKSLNRIATNFGCVWLVRSVHPVWAQPYKTKRAVCLVGCVPA